MKWCETPSNTSQKDTYKDILICIRNRELVVVVRNSKLAATSNAPEQPNQIGSGTEHPTVPSCRVLHFSVILMLVLDVIVRVKIGEPIL